MLLKIGSFLWVAFICILLFLPQDELPSREFIVHQDKIAHFVLFSVYAFLWLTAYKKNQWFGEAFSAITIIVFGIALAGFSELIQANIPGRSADWIDFSVDLLGLTAGIFFHFLTEKRNQSAVK